MSISISITASYQSSQEREQKLLPGLVGPVIEHDLARIGIPFPFNDVLDEVATNGGLASAPLPQSVGTDTHQASGEETGRDRPDLDPVLSEEEVEIHHEHV